MHYVRFIKFKGSLDNFDTAYAERLHIDMAKNAYDATNHRNELPQMTRWLERHKKILHFSDYIAWRLDGSPSLTKFMPISYPTSCIKMTKEPSRRNIYIEDIIDKYGAEYFEDALLRYVAQHNNPDATAAQIEEDALSMDLLTSGLPIYHKAKFWLGHSAVHPLSCNEYNVVHAVPNCQDTQGRTVAGHFDAVLISDGKSEEISIQGEYFKTSLKNCI